MNKCFLLTTMVIAACNSPSNSKRIDLQHNKNNSTIYNVPKISTTNDSSLKVKIDSLVKLRKITQAEQIVDSLIKANPNNGYAYFEKGFFNEYNKNFPIAILYYTKAKNLNYRKAKCEEEIVWCNRVMKMLDK